MDTREDSGVSREPKRLVAGRDSALRESGLNLALLGMRKVRGKHHQNVCICVYVAFSNWLPAAW